MRNNLSKRIVVLLLMMYLSKTAVAAPEIDSRPRIAFVISGGGLKSLAVIGVYKVMVELGVPIDFVCGVSMGSIMGVLIANRYHPDDLEKLVLSFDWNLLFNGAVQRRHLNMEEKAQDAQYPVSLPLFKLWSGLMEGQEVVKALCLMTVPVHDLEDFAKFPIPFLCVATDIATLKPVTLQSGFVVEAVRASMAIAILFTPVRMNGQVLADGAMTDNLPAEIAKKLGVDYVICVDVGSQLRSSEDLGSIKEILMQIMKRDAKSKTLPHACCDLLISPDMQGFEVSDFDKIPAIIKRGEQAARAAFQNWEVNLRALAETKPQQFNKVPTRQDTIFIASLDFIGLQANDRKFVAAQFGIKSPCRVTLGKIEEGIDRVYGLKLFERVAYQINDIGHGKRLAIRVAEKNSKAFRFGLNLQNDRGTSLIFNTTFRNLTGPGSRLSMDLRTGRIQRFEAGYLAPLLHGPKFGLKLGTSYTKTFIAKYEGVHRAEKYRCREIVGEVSVGTFFSRSNKFALGMQSELCYLDPHVALSQSARARYANLISFGLWQLDTFDRTVYPSKGAFVSFKNEKVYKIRKGLKFMNPGWRHFFDGQARASIRPRLSIMSRVQVGKTLSSTSPRPRQFYLGDMDSFAGLQPDELSGAQMLTLQLGLQYEAEHNKFLILRWNLGKTSPEWHRLFMKAGFRTGKAVTFGWATLLGPIEATVAHGDRHGLQMHFNFGYKL